jgi:competence protein ComEA
MTARADSPPDWTAGPAKWVAVVILGLSSVVGMAWSIFRASAPTPTPARPAASARETAPSQPAPTPPAATPQALGAAADAPAAPAPSAAPHRRRINLNTASSAELQLLPGVGPAVAQRIIDHRASSGPFKRIQDLDGVRGIGPRTLDKLRDLVTIE